MSVAHAESPSPQTIKDETIGIVVRLAVIRSTPVEDRPVVNLVSLFTNEEVRVFKHIAVGFNDNSGRQIFVFKEDMSPEQLRMITGVRRSTVPGTTEPNAIYILHENRYRPCDAFNANYLDKARYMARRIKTY